MNPVQPFPFAAAAGARELVVPVDVPVRRSTSFAAWLVLVLLLSLAIVVSISERRHRSDDLTAWLPAVAPCCLLLIPIFIARRRSRAASALLEHLQRNPDASFEDLLRPETPAFRYASRLAVKPRRLLRLLLEAERWGALVRCSKHARKFRPPLWPIGVSFEPILLDEAGDEFQEWRACLGGQGRKRPSSWGSLGRRFKRSQQMTQTSPLVLLLIILMLGPVGGPSLRCHSSPMANPRASGCFRVVSFTPDDDSSSAGRPASWPGTRAHERSISPALPGCTVVSA